MSSEQAPVPSTSADRRAFLGLMIGAFLTACTSESATTTSSVASIDASTTTSNSAATTPLSTTSSASERPIVEPLEAPAVEVSDSAFGLGVASGEPDHASVVLWTRLIGDLPDAFDIVWELAVDPDMALLVATGLVTVSADTGHAVKVLPEGLDPDQHYFFRFRAGSVESPTARTRTLPIASDMRPIALGISSCQARSDGRWAAHADLATADIDAVLWLGDYIYGEYRTLDEYRAAYAEYRSDPQLRKCHAAHPWFVFTDDHEVANDYDASVDPARRSAALRAWWENQPTRLSPPDADGHLDTFRSFPLGGAARLVGLDVRQFADGSSLLGDAQWDFVEQSARHRAANTLIASPTLMSGVRDLSGDPLLSYSIDGREGERVRLADALATMPTPIIVSGDLHTALVADYRADPLDASSPSVAVEIMAPAISSAFPERFAAFAPLLPLVNPQLRSVEVGNGWLRLELSPAGPSAEFHFVDDVTDPGSSVRIAPIPDL